MTKYYLILVMILGVLKATSQTILFEDDFESYTNFTIDNFGQWVMHDVDATPTWGVPETDFPNEGYTGSGIIFNPSQCTTDVSGAGNYTPLSGDKYLSFWCAIETTNNNYLVSPKISLVDMASPLLTFYAKSLADAINGFEAEKFEVLLSTTGTEVADFTESLGTVNEISECCSWNEYVYDLSAYIGNDIHIAIHHISSELGYALHIDDFKVEGTSTADIKDFNTITISLSPNPAKDVLNIKSDKIIDKIKINDLLGKRVLDTEIKATEVRLPIISLEKGIYLIEINTAFGKRIMKFIKE